MQTLDEMRADVLDRMERGTLLIRVGLTGAVLVELFLLVTALRIMDRSNPLHQLVLLLAVCGYTIVVLGLVVLGGHVTRMAASVIAALEPREPT